MAEVRIVEKNHYFRQKLASCSFFATNKASLSSFFFSMKMIYTILIFDDQIGETEKVKQERKKINASI